MPLDSFQLTQGAALAIDVTLRDAAGVVVGSAYPGGGYAGTEPLATAIWAGGVRAAAFVAATTWTDPAAGMIRVVIDDDRSAALVPGNYDGETTLDDSGTTVDVYNFTLVVVPMPGGVPPLPTSDRITRLPVEVELVDRYSALLLILQKSVNADGSNVSLTGPIGASLQTLGVTPAIPGLVTDADLALLDPAKFFLLCDLAGYYLLRNCLNGFAQPDQTSGNTKVQFNYMMRRFKTQMDAMEKQYASYLGRYRSTLSAGSIRIAGPSHGHRSGYRHWGEY